MEIREVSPHEAPMDLLLEADPSPERIGAYLNRSRSFVAFEEGKPVGICVLEPLSPGVRELVNIAVLPERQREGIGTALLREAVARARAEGAWRIEVGTGSFGHPLAFYQKEGFRASSIERNFFTENYPEPIYEDGIRLRDRIRLVLEWPLP